MIFNQQQTCMHLNEIMSSKLYNQRFNLLSEKQIDKISTIGPMHQQTVLHIRMPLLAKARKSRNFQNYLELP
jgi:hypothetical protein